MMTSASTSNNKTTWLFLLSNVLMYVNNNLLLLLTIYDKFMKDVNININSKMLSVVIHAAYESSDYCRKNLFKYWLCI